VATGLTLGKFAPPHKGHQLLIDRALAEVDHLIVVVYDAPDATTVPLPIRAGWIKALYPTAEVLEAWDGPTVVGDTPEIRALHEGYLLRLLAGRRIDRFYSSEFYGQHVSQAFGAVDRRIDESRSLVPISGTEIRADPHRHRRFLDPLVYRELVARVVLLGAPSTGKTTLAAALADRSRTAWMPEYGREYWEAHQVDRRLTPEQLVEIAEGHIEREDALLLDADRFLFVDTDATTTHNFALHYHGQAHPLLAELAALTSSRYDLFLLCGDEIPYDDTPDRSGQADRALLQKKTRADLIRRRTPFFPVSGPLSTRLRTVSALLRDFDRFRPLSENLFSAFHPLGGPT
jgi:NadR type nicotinamide-nucleotide adenylyltransferase